MAFDDSDALFKKDIGAGETKETPRWSVLVIDDDPAVRDTLGAILRSQYQVTLCASAQEGVDAAQEETCAVILDVKMSGRDGFWACNEIRKKYPDVPVIFYSAYQDAKDPYRIINEHRPFAYIIKDGTSKKLLEAVHMAVKLHSIILYNRQLLSSLQKSRNRHPSK